MIEGKGIERHSGMIEGFAVKGNDSDSARDLQ